MKEQIIFPEIDYDPVDAIRGMDIAITTTARDDDQGRALLEAFKFPFRKERPANGEDNMVKREKHRGKLVKQVREQAGEAQGNHPQAEDDGRGREAAQAQAAAMPRDAVRSRLRNRCAITGRSRGVLPQVRSGAHEAARSDDARRHSRPRARPAGKPGTGALRMSMTDPIADFLTRIRNGQTAGKPEVQVPASKLKLAIAKVLKEEGYIGTSSRAENATASRR